MKNFFAWIIKPPWRWPTWPRRTFLLTLPVSLPLWAVCWILGLMVSFVALLFALAVAGTVYLVMLMWEGDGMYAGCCDKDGRPN